MFGYIYKITNLINNKIYIGKTKYSIETRFKNHLWSIDHHRTKSLLYDAMNKYGKDNFKVEQIDQADSLEELNKKEQYWISKLNSRNPSIGYNICKGGECGPGGPMFKGHQHTEQTKQQMSIDRSGSKNSNYGNRWNQSDDLKALHSRLSSGENNGMYGKHHSNQTKQLIRDSKKGKIWITNLKTLKTKFINPEDLNLYIEQGWEKGRLI